MSSLISTSFNCRRIAGTFTLEDSIWNPSKRVPPVHNTVDLNELREYLKGEVEFLKAGAIPELSYINKLEGLIKKVTTDPIKRSYWVPGFPSTWWFVTEEDTKEKIGGGSGYEEKIRDLIATHIDVMMNTSTSHAPDGLRELKRFTHEYATRQRLTTVIMTGCNDHELGVNYAFCDAR